MTAMIFFLQVTADKLVRSFLIFTNKNVDYLENNIPEAFKDWIVGRNIRDDEEKIMLFCIPLNEGRCRQEFQNKSWLDSNITQTFLQSCFIIKSLDHSG